MKQSLEKGSLDHSLIIRITFNLLNVTPSSPDPVFLCTPASPDIIELRQRKSSDILERLKGVTRTRRVAYRYLIWVGECSESIQLKYHVCYDKRQQPKF